MSGEASDFSYLDAAHPPEPEPDLAAQVAQRLTDLTYRAVQHASSNTERSAQQQDFLLGMSDLGHCAEYVRRMILKMPFTDERDKTPAFIGSVVGEAIEEAIIAVEPDKGWVRQQAVITDLPSGYSILGHVDLFNRHEVVDVKTKDGTEVARREGSTQAHFFQKHGYALGLVQAGQVDPENLMVSNIYFDRSGKEPHPYVITEPWDPTIGEQIDAWLEGPFYAVMHGEEASRDMPRDWCERFCEHFTGCRLFDTDVTGKIEAPDAVAAIEVYEDGKELKRRGTNMMEQARDLLLTVDSGSTGTHFLRWTVVNKADGSSYRKIDIRPIKK